jgi:hypothetical protein
VQVVTFVVTSLAANERVRAESRDEPTTPLALTLSVYSCAVNSMDFRSPSRMGDTDEAILEEPYRPFYHFFYSKPVLVKQYASRVKIAMKTPTNKRTETTSTVV